MKTGALHQALSAQIANGKFKKGKKKPKTKPKY